MFMENGGCTQLEAHFMRDHVAVSRLFDPIEFGHGSVTIGRRRSM
jgi:hypothetical protein